MLQFSPILSCRRWFEVILRRIYIVMSCVRPQHGADCFHPKWAVDTRYPWQVHCFQIWWRSHPSAGISIEKQLAQPSQCCNESGKYCRRLQPTTKKGQLHKDHWSQTQNSIVLHTYPISAQISRLGPYTYRILAYAKKTVSCLPTQPPGQTGGQMPWAITIPLVQG